MSAFSSVTAFGFSMGWTKFWHRILEILLLHKFKCFKGKRDRNICQCWTSFNNAALLIIFLPWRLLLVNLQMQTHYLLQFSSINFKLNLLVKNCENLERLSLFIALMITKKCSLMSWSSTIFKNYCHLKCDVDS